MTDDIVKRIVLHVPIERVWEAITDSSRFGAWFGADLDGPFREGQATTGRIVPTSVDPEIAALQQPHVGRPWVAHVDVIEPMRRFVFRWNPAEGSDALTTVTFALEEVEDGVALTITESGFDALQDDLRDRARRDNDGGWEAQARLIAAYLVQHP